MADVDGPPAPVLERKLQRVRVIAFLAFLLAAANVGWSLLRDPSIVDGRLFVARDEAGRVRAMLGVAEEGVGLTMYDSTGRMRVDLGVAPGNVPGLLMLGRNGEPVATLNLVEGQVPTLRLTNVSDRIRIELSPRNGAAPLLLSRPGADSVGPPADPR